MALTLSLKPGELVYIEDKSISVANVRSRRDFDLATEDGLFTLKQDEWTPVLPGCSVMVSDNLPRDTQLVRIRIDAPNKKVGRKNYRAKE